MSKKELNPLEQILVDTIQKASSVTGEVYDAAKGASAKAIDFAQAQIPDIIHQLLMWKLTEAIAYIFIAIAFLTAFFVFWFKINAFCKKERDNAAIILYSTIGGVVIIGGSIACIIDNTLIALQIWVAPKIYLIEYAADLLNKIK